LDPSQAPGTGTPEIGGLMTWQILNILSNLTELNWIGFDITEVSPPYDHAELTSLAAATLVWNFMCLIQLKLTQNILQLC
jgi:agmatinase